jgi:hypothetical protein
MKNVFLEISVGTLLAGGVLLAYVKRIKNRLKSRILRNYTNNKT